MTQDHHSLRDIDSRKTVLPGDTLEKDTHSSTEKLSAAPLYLRDSMR